MDFRVALSKLLYESAISQTYLKLQKSQWLSTQELCNLQQERLKKLLIHAKTFVPYYQSKINNFYEESAINDTLIRLPILSRELLQENMMNLCDERTGIRHKSCVKSSGTTGMAVQVFLDKDSIDYSRSLRKRGDYEWTNVSFNSKRVFLTTRRSIKKYSLQRLGEIIRRNWRLNIFNHETCTYLNGIDLEPVINKLIRFNPAVITGNASGIHRIAEFCIENKLKPLNLEAVISISEVLSERTKQMAERAFGCRIYNQYGSSEFGTIAAECPNGKLHINAERFIVEILKDGLPVPDGEEGEIVITDLINHGFPLIRYATGDIGIIGTTPCSCGRKLPVIEKILGRTIDYIPTPSGEKVYANYIDHLIYKHFSNREIKQAQLLQTALNHLVIRIVPGPKYQSDFDGKIINVVKRAFYNGEMDLSLDFSNQILISKTGKFQFYHRCFNN